MKLKITELATGQKAGLHLRLIFEGLLAVVSNIYLVWEMLQFRKSMLYPVPGAAVTSKTIRKNFFFFLTPVFTTQVHNLE